MAEVYPRILIINGDPFNRKTATGITLSSLFNKWEKDKIAMIYCHPIEPETDICDRYWRVTKSIFPIATTLKSIKKFFSKINADNTQGLTGKITKGNDELVSVSTHNEVLGAWSDMATFHIPKQMWEWIEEFKPDLVYSLLASTRIMNLVMKVGQRFSIPIVPHFMDDWPTTLYAGRTGTEIPRWYLLFWLRRILSRSSVGMTISDAMAEEYKRRYNKTVYAFMNCVDLSVVPTESPNRENSCIRFGYIGGLHLNRWQLLNDIGDALQKISNEGLPVELVVYAPSSDIATYSHILSRNSVVKVIGTLASDRVISFFQQCDVLVHVESFDKTDRLYTRFSISTKIPQYMSSGRPILAYGPSEIASCRYIEENGCGVVVGSRQLDLLSQELKNLAVDRSVRKCLGGKGRDVAKRKHDAIKEQERFRKLLKTVADNGN